MVLAVGVVLAIVSICPVLAVVVLIQQVLWQVVVRPGQLQGVVVFFGDDFQHLGIVVPRQMARAALLGQLASLRNRGPVP